MNSYAHSNNLVLHPLVELAQYGGMKADDAKRLKELDKENARLKKIVADQALDIDMLKDVAREKF